MEKKLREILARLYAPGSGTAPVRSWPAVVRTIRRGDGWTSPTEALDQAGLPYEALLLGHECRPMAGDLWTALDPQIAMIWPLVGRVARGQATSAVEVSLDAPRLPPAVWIAGDIYGENGREMVEPRRPTLAGIGSRSPSPEAWEFARAVGRNAAREGITLLSGGAEGCDTAFAIGHGAAAAILPHGIDRPRDLLGTAIRISAFARDAEFSRERAMRRNALIVAGADLTVVAHARLREGGSWHAALGALRRRAPLAVYVGPGAGSGARGLVALGALPVHDPDEALAALALVRGLRPADDAAERWAERCGRVDERRQPALL